MSKACFTIIDKFKRIENKIKLNLPNDVIKHQYILYDYTNIDDNSDEDFIVDDIISLLDKIPNNFEIIAETDYSKKSYILELISYIYKNNSYEKVNSFKIKFGLN